MDFRRFGGSIAASVALFLALPVAAQESAAPAAPIALPGELPTILAYDSDWTTKGNASAQKIEKQRKVEMWSLALIGPAAMIFTVTALGLTITVRSLRKDFRHQRSLDQYWRHGAISRAKNRRE
jgi:hypothetical protein